MGLISGTLQVLQTLGSAVASTARRFVACNYLDQVVVVHPDIAPLTWDATSSSMYALPGLPVGTTYRGVNAFQGFLVLWNGNVLTWSDLNDFTMWIPVGATAGSFVFETAQPFTLTAPGIETATIYVTENPNGLIVGQFCRLDSAPTYTFFSVTSVIPSTGSIGVASGFSQSFAPLAAMVPLFLQSFVAYLSGGQIYPANSPTSVLNVAADAIQTGAVDLVLAGTFSQPGVGQSVVVSTTSTPIVSPGTYVSVGPNGTAGNDIYQVINVNELAQTITLMQMGVGSSSATVHYAGELITDQQCVLVTNPSSSVTVTTSFDVPVNEVFGFTLTPLNLTGASATGTVYPTGTQILTVDANSAGQAVNTGSLINGPILHFDTLADQGYIFKRRSIQSVQYVGSAQGTFFIRPEITDEGLIGDYTFVKVGNDQMYIWGNRNIYRFTGFNQLTPIATQHIKQLMAELDMSRANQIIGYHNERDYEIWFVYPRVDQYGTSALRVFIFNYIENSCTIDDYPGSFSGISALGRIEVDQDLSWTNTVGTWAAPTSFSTSTEWFQESGDSNPTHGIIATLANQPPFAASMTMQAMSNLYYSAHPTNQYYADPIQVLKTLNTYWQLTGGWPALSVVAASNQVDADILAAFGYVAGSGIPSYFLNGSPSSTPGLLVYDNDFTSRNNDPVLCRYESVDYDGGDPLKFKYADTQWFSIQVKSKRSIAMPMLVWIGSKANYDDDITWSQATVIWVSGNKNYVTKTNIKASGRYFRLRIQAATPGMSFRISQVRILGRLGNTY